MQYEITYAHSALKSLRKLDGGVARRILTATGALAQDPRPPGCLQLKGGSGEMRIRVGDYRIIYLVEDDVLLVVVVTPGHRRDVYHR